MVAVKELRKWMAESDHSAKWIARECGVDVRTVQNWLSSGSIPPKQQNRVAELMAMESETLHTIPIKLRNPEFLRVKKQAIAEDIPLDEYCRRAVIDGI